MLFTLAIAPVFILLMFTYVKDRYEKEPRFLLVLGAFYGLILVAVVLCIDVILMETQAYNKFPVLFQAFVTSAANEEGIKFLFLFFLIYRNPNFNEPVDGIIYSIFVSLGFAAGENIIYVFSPELGGFETALLRSICSVPAHGIFACFMGFYFARFKYLNLGIKNLLLSFFAPWAVHSGYNLILLSEIKNSTVFFIIYLILIFALAIKKFKAHLNLSPFKP